VRTDKGYVRVAVEAADGSPVKEEMQAPGAFLARGADFKQFSVPLDVSADLIVNVLNEL
jgi:hypothetical protein